MIKVVVSGLILAAGESSRMMKSPKALLQIGGETFVRAIAGKLRECGVEPVMVVAGPHHSEIEREIGRDCRVVFNDQYRLGQFSSLQRGVRELPGVPGIVVWPVDTPLVKPETPAALISAFLREGKPITIPVFGSRRGHPVIYSREAADATLGMDAAVHNGKDLRTMFAGRVCEVPVDDPGVLIDIDTPEDYAKHVSAEPQSRGGR